MKTLIAICFGVCFNLFTVQPTPAAPEEAPAVKDEICSLSITGYANFEEVGRIRVTMRAQGDTCEEAAAQLRDQIIRRQLSIIQ